MQPGTIGAQLGFVSHRADQRMSECEDGTWSERHLVDEFSLEKFVDLVRCPPGSPTVPLRNGTRSPPLRSTFALTSSRADRCEPRSWPEARQGRARPPRFVGTRTHQKLPRQPHARRDRGRSPRRRTDCLRLTCDLIDERGHRGIRTQELGGKRPGLRIIQRCKRNSVRTRQTVERAAILRSVGDEHQRVGARDHRTELGDHRFADLRRSSGHPRSRRSSGWSAPRPLCSAAR